MSDPILAALRRLKPARVVVVSESGEREIALRGAGGPGGAGRWQRAAATARALGADDEGARIELRDATGHVLAAIGLGDDDDDDDDAPRSAAIVMPPPDQRDERILTLLVSAQRAALEEQRVLIGPVLESYTALAQGYAAYAAQVVELVRVAAVVRSEVEDRAVASPGSAADSALLEMLTKIPMNGAGPKA